MNSKDIIVIVGLVIGFSFIIYKIISDKKRGKACSSCCGCPMINECGSKKY